jgi:hypothetical protein
LLRFYKIDERCYSGDAIAWIPVGVHFLRDFGTLLAGEGFSRVPLKIGPLGNILFIQSTGMSKERICR